MIRSLAKLVLKYPLRLINKIYTRSYYGQGLKSLGSKLDDIGDEDVLIIAPHVDDETIGLGGTLLRYRQLKGRKVLVYVADGSGAVSSMSKEELVEARKKEALEVAGYYGIEEVHFLDHPDCQVDYKDPKAIASLLEILRDLRPGRIFTPFLFDGHIDHINSSKLLLEAVSQWNKNFNEIWMYEVNTPNDLRLINRVIKLGKKTFKEKESIYKVFESQNVMGFDAYSLLDRRKALLTGDMDSYAAEVFISLSYSTAIEIRDMLDKEEFKPEIIRQLSSQYNMMIAFLKNKRLKRVYNNYLNYILKSKHIEGEIKIDKGFI